MARIQNSVERAVERWVEKGLLSRDTAEILRGEARQELRREAGRWTQYALAGTGGGILIVAGATFLAWAWPGMGYAGQAVTLGIIGVVVTGLGVRLLGTRRLAPAAYLLQLSGPILLLLALAYSENAWPDRTWGGIVSGVLALGAPFLLIRLAFRTDPVLSALHAALSFLFFFLFLDRALGLGMEASLWVLDGLGVAGLAGLAFRLRNPSGEPWVLSTFFALLYASLALVFFSGVILWDLEAYAIIPADVWLLTVAGISVWALQDGFPEHLRRDWYERQLAYSVLLAIPFAFMTTLEAMDTGPTAAALSVGVVGILGLWFSIPRGTRSVLLSSCLALFIAAWYYGAEKAGAFGAVVSLGVVAVLLFWGSSRLGSREKEPER